MYFYTNHFLDWIWIFWNLVFKSSVCCCFSLNFWKMHIRRRDGILWLISYVFFSSVVVVCVRYLVYVSSWLHELELAYLVAIKLTNFIWWWIWLLCTSFWTFGYFCCCCISSFIFSILSNSYDPCVIFFER